MAPPTGLLIKTEKTELDVLVADLVSLRLVSPNPTTSHPTCTSPPADHSSDFVLSSASSNENDLSPRKAEEKPGAGNLKEEDGDWIDENDKEEGNEKVRKNLDYVEGWRHWPLLPDGRCFDLAARFIWDDLMVRCPRTIYEWYAPMLNVLKHTFPVNNGYIITPRRSKVCEDDMFEGPFLEVSRVTRRNPLRIRTVLIVHGTNQPASMKFSSDFKQYPTNETAFICRNVLEERQQTAVFWLGFYGFYWGFGIQKAGKEIQQIAPASDVWVDIEQIASEKQLKQLARAVEKGFPLPEPDYWRKSPCPLRTIFHRCGKKYIAKEMLTGWMGAWVGVLTAMFPAKAGYLLQLAGDPGNAEKTPLLKIVKVDQDKKGIASTRTVLLFVSRSVHLQETASGMKMVPAVPGVIANDMLELVCRTVGQDKVMWIYAVPPGWIGGEAGLVEGAEPNMNLTRRTKWHKVVHGPTSFMDLKDIGCRARLI